MRCVLLLLSLSAALAWGSAIPEGQQQDVVEASIFFLKKEFLRKKFCMSPVGNGSKRETFSIFFLSFFPLPFFPCISVQKERRGRTRKKFYLISLLLFFLQSRRRTANIWRISFPYMRTYVCTFAFFSINVGWDIFRRRCLGRPSSGEGGEAARVGRVAVILIKASGEINAQPIGWYY